MAGDPDLVELQLRNGLDAAIGIEDRLPDEPAAGQGREAAYDVTELPRRRDTLLNDREDRAPTTTSVGARLATSMAARDGRVLGGMRSELMSCGPSCLETPEVVIRTTPVDGFGVGRWWSRCAELCRAEALELQGGQDRPGADPGGLAKSATQRR